MKIGSQVKFDYKQAFRLSSWFNIALIVVGIVVFLHSPAKAINLEVIGKVDNTTSYYLHMDSTAIVYVECSGSTSEASLGYLSNQQAVTCPE